MTIVTSGTEAIIEQVTKQLNKLVDVVKLRDLTEGQYLGRELLLVKVVASTAEQKDDIKRLADIFRGRIIDVTGSTYTLETDRQHGQGRCLSGLSCPDRTGGSGPFRDTGYRTRQKSAQGLDPGPYSEPVPPDAPCGART